MPTTAKRPGRVAGNSPTYVSNVQRRPRAKKRARRIRPRSKKLVEIQR